jgi:methionyl-tRNA synthetase
MLMGQDDYILADNVVANEYFNIMNRATGVAEKGSKSKGNMISVRWMAERFSTDAIRYYLCANAPESKDSAFDWDEFQQRYNGELCDVVGNFVHRSLTMVVKNFDSKVPEPGPMDDDDTALLELLPQQLDGVGEAIEGFRFRMAMERFIDIGRRANQYFDTKAPWTTRKTDMQRTATTLYVCCQVVRVLATAMAPFMPNGAATLADIIGVTLPKNGPDGGEDGWEAAKQPMPAGSPLNTPTVLFPKLDKDYIAEIAELHLQGKAN